MKKPSRTVPRRRQSVSPTPRHLPLVDILIDTQAALQELVVASGLKVLEAMLEEDRANRMAIQIIARLTSIRPCYSTCAKTLSARQDPNQNIISDTSRDESSRFAMRGRRVAAVLGCAAVTRAVHASRTASILNSRLNRRRGFRSIEHLVRGHYHPSLKCPEN